MLSLLIFFISLISLSHADATCSPTLIGEGIGIYANIVPYNVTYLSYTIPPTASIGELNISFSTFNPTHNITMYVGWGDISCPDQFTHNFASNGTSVKFILNNPNITTYYFSLQFTVSDNTTQKAQAIINYNVGCPSWCNGGGAWCSSQTGCFCGTNYYSPMTGCHVNGTCDPFSNKTNACVLPQFENHGYGMQNCTYTDLSNVTTVWGQCVIVYCNTGYSINYQQNICETPLSTVLPDHHDHFVGPLTKAEFFGIVIGGSVAVILVVAITIIMVRRKRHHYHSISKDHY